MAKEVRSIDVANDAEEFYINAYRRFGWELVSSQRVYNQDTTPVGAITYKGEHTDYTYVRTETYTTDFTKLLFERERKMAHYAELVELEDEFWENCAVVSKGRPSQPPNITNIKRYANWQAPDIRTKAEKRIPHIMFGVLMAVIFFLTMSPHTSGMWNEGASSIALFNGLGITAILWWLTCFVIRWGILIIAALNPNSRYRARLEAIYNDWLESIELYDTCYHRMEIILLEANDLLDE